MTRRESAIQKLLPSLLLAAGAAFAQPPRGPLAAGLRRDGGGARGQPRGGGHRPRRPPGDRPRAGRLPTDRGRQGGPDRLLHRGARRRRRGRSCGRGTGRRGGRGRARPGARHPGGHHLPGLHRRLLSARPRPRPGAQGAHRRARRAWVPRTAWRWSLSTVPGSRCCRAGRAPRPSSSAPCARRPRAPPSASQRLADKRNQATDAAPPPRPRGRQRARSQNRLNITERFYAETLEQQVSNMVSGAAAALRGFANPPGRKVMAVLAGGWPYDPADFAANEFGALDRRAGPAARGPALRAAGRHRQPARLHDLRGRRAGPRLRQLRRRRAGRAAQPRRHRDRLPARNEHAVVAAVHRPPDRRPGAGQRRAAGDAVARRGRHPLLLLARLHARLAGQRQPAPGRRSRSCAPDSSCAAAPATSTCRARPRSAWRSRACCCSAAVRACGRCR